MERYQIYEDRKTYLLEVDHSKKEFAVGSIKGKKKIFGYRQIDTTGYKAQILRIGVEYKCLSNRLSDMQAAVNQ